MTSEKVGAVVVHYKNGPEIRTCLQTLVDETKIRNIFVVDNSNGEFEGDFSVSDSSKLTILKPSRNLGYSAGNNLGIRHAYLNSCTHILVANPDTALRMNSVNALLSEMQEKSWSLISPRLQEVELLTNATWDLFFGKGSDAARSRNGYQKEIFFGACFLAEMRLLNIVGLLNENLFLYGEELDYTIRIEEANEKWGVSRSVTVDHLRAASTGDKSKNFGRSRSTVTLYNSARSSLINARLHYPKKVFNWTFWRLLFSVKQLATGQIINFFAVTNGIRAGLFKKINSKYSHLDD